MTFYASLGDLVTVASIFSAAARVRGSDSRGGDRRRALDRVDDGVALRRRFTAAVEPRTSTAAREAFRSTRTRYAA